MLSSRQQVALKFIEKRLVKDPKGKILNHDMNQSLIEFASKEGVVISSRQVASSLRPHGVDYKASNGRYYYRGVAFRPVVPKKPLMKTPVVVRVPVISPSQASLSLKTGFLVSQKTRKPVMKPSFHTLTHRKDVRPVVYAPLEPVEPKMIIPEVKIRSLSRKKHIILSMTIFYFFLANIFALGYVY